MLGLDLSLLKIKKIVAWLHDFKKIASQSESCVAHQMGFGRKRTERLLDDQCRRKPDNSLFGILAEVSRCGSDGV